MAVTTGTAILMGAAGSAVASYLSSKQASKAAGQAASTEAAAYDRGAAEQRRQFDITRADLAPWMQAGMRALGKYEAGINDPSGYMKSPGYDWLLSEGVNAVNRGASARGKLGSGQTSKDLMKYGMGLASQDYSNYMNRLAALSGIGQSTASTVGQMGMQTAGNISNLYGQQGQAYAGGITNQANARTGMYRSLANIGSNAADDYMLYKLLAA